MIPALISVGAGILVALLGVVFQAGMLREQLKGVLGAMETLRKDIKEQSAEMRAEYRASAKDQGRRVGNVESYIGLTADGIPVERIGDFSGRVRAPKP
jgi:hypothetical protein